MFTEATAKGCLFRVQIGLKLLSALQDGFAAALGSAAISLLRNIVWA